MKNIALFALAIIFYTLGSASILSEFIIVLGKHNFPEFQISEILLMDSLSAILIAPLFPRILSLNNIFHNLCFSLLLRSIFGCFIIFSSSNIILLYIFMLGFGASGIIFITTTKMWLNNLAPHDKKALYFGVMTTSITFGLLLGYIITELFTNINFVALSLICWIITIFLLFFISNPHKTQTSILSFAQIFSRIESFLLSGLVFHYITFALGNYIVFYLMNLEYNLVTAKIIYLYLIICKLLVDIPCGLLIDKINRISTKRTSMLLSLLCPILILYSTNLAMLMIILIIYIACLSYTYLSALAYLGNSFSGPNLSKAASIFLMFNALGIYSGIYLTSSMINRFHASGLIFSITVITMIFCFFTSKTNLR